MKPIDEDTKLAINMEIYAGSEIGWIPMPLAFVGQRVGFGDGPTKVRYVDNPDSEFEYRK